MCDPFMPLWLCVKTPAFHRSAASNKNGLMVQIEIEYLGGLRCTAIHGPSKTQLITDAPVDNHGKGESFSPTDLVATAMGTCMLTIMGIYAENNGIDLAGTKISVTKEMTTVPVRRIARLNTEIRLALPQSHPKREALERAALSCPVHQSLHPEVEKPVRFLWAEVGARGAGGVMKDEV